MNQNQVGNQQTNIPQTPQMNDRDFINDMLSTEKYLKNGYDIAQNEASHQPLFQALNMIYTETQTCQRELYNLMLQKGWYTLEQAEQPKMQQKMQQFSQYMNQIPYQQ
ncbi:spore coat protein [Microbacteriaceae bacterium 4G12]